MFKFYIELIIILAIFSININARVVYLLAHGEKPKEGVMDESVEGGTVMSSMDGLGHKDDGLGYTGMLRAACMMDNFGPNAPYYRRPKRIIIQHFMLQNNGNYIHNGKRGHHTSRRMYHQTYALGRALGIDLDKELCCGGSYDDIIKYIFSLPVEDDPILIVNQHSVCNHIAQALALSYGVTPPANFGKDAAKIWTIIDGRVEEEWYMYCPTIPNQRYTDPKIVPRWTNSYKFASTVQNQPLPNVVKYPSYIFTPYNTNSNWNFYRYELRRRGVWSGEECFNEDIVKPIVNITNRGDVYDP